MAQAPFNPSAGRATRNLIQKTNFSFRGICSIEIANQASSSESKANSKYGWKGWNNKCLKFILPDKLTRVHAASYGKKSPTCPMNLDPCAAHPPTNTPACCLAAPLARMPDSLPARQPAGPPARQLAGSPIRQLASLPARWPANPLVRNPPPNLGVPSKGKFLIQTFGLPTNC